MRRVYFIRPIGMQGPVKIGCSASPSGRLTTLETWCPFPLELVASISGDGKLERRFHHRFRADHIRHEWFNWSPELQAVIDAVAAEAFDIETLPEPLRVTHRSRDNSYSTPGWRYARSLQHRLDNLRRRGLPASEISASGIRTLGLDRAGPEALEAAKQACEPIIAAWTERFPRKSRRTPKRLAA